MATKNTNPEESLVFSFGKFVPRKNTIFANTLSIRGLYRKLVPTRLRNSAIITRLKMRALSHRMFHNRIYNSEYYARDVEARAVRSAGSIADSIIATFAPKRVIDIGCGTGALLEALRERGCEVFGLEYSDAALKYCSYRHLNVAKFDLESDAIGDESGFDVAVSMEVAEHLPEKIANRYVDLIAHMAPQIVFTAAPPGQGGTDHVNLQPPQYWKAKFQQRGFEYAEEVTQRWHDDWQVGGEVESWYYDNLMIFRKKNLNDNLAAGRL